MEQHNIINVDAQHSVLVRIPGLSSPEYESSRRIEETNTAAPVYIESCSTGIGRLYASLRQRRRLHATRRHVTGRVTRAAIVSHASRHTSQHVTGDINSQMKQINVIAVCTNNAAREGYPPTSTTMSRRSRGNIMKSRDSVNSRKMNSHRKCCCRAPMSLYAASRQYRHASVITPAAIIECR